MEEKTLVFTACYNEALNIARLIDEIVQNAPDADILIVDDNSPDGTFEIIKAKEKQYSQLKGVLRPRKLGIGSAHKYAVLYSIKNGYDTLLTMDADFSHNPESIPSLRASHGPNIFVTGSRYCKGGQSDYKGYRDIVSRVGNILARFVLGIDISELTTYFRVFDVRALSRLPLRKINSDGYSYGLELLYYMRQCGVEFREVPIHFIDRMHGSSKIPKLQVIRSTIDLFFIGLKRIIGKRNNDPDLIISDACALCNDNSLSMKHSGSTESTRRDNSNAGMEYRCTSVGTDEYPTVYICLRCGLEQVPASFIPNSLDDIYRDVSDDLYITNKLTRAMTYSYLYDRIEKFLPEEKGTILEVGSYCGFFLREAIARGWNAVGIEPSLWASKYARDVTGVDVRTGFLEEKTNDLSNRYDVVVTWDVLEHVKDPVNYIETCGGFLNPGSILCLSTLDIDSWFPRIMGKRWPWLMNMHIIYFSRDTLEDTLHRAGFKLLHVEPYRHYARISYIFTAGTRIFPLFMKNIFSRLAYLVPDNWVLPISFGDIKLYIAIKLP